ncbi:MAG: GAF domain-containing protein [Chloroflexi bacterium]|nr:GAF domain-containing protein [Chloroflexota bacterium]
MPETKEKSYYKAVRRASTAVNSGKTLKQKLDVITRAISRSMDAGTSLVLLDSTKSKLLCASSCGLPQYYLRKGVLDADKSLTEIMNGTTVIVSTNDTRLQYPEMAIKAGILSIIGVPVKLENTVTGSIRVYVKTATAFTNQDTSFLTTMANMASLALISVRNITEKDQNTIVETTEIQRTDTVKFAHPSEKEFAQILDFYNIEWVYEPHSFPLQKDGDRITMMFTRCLHPIFISRVWIFM